MTDEYAWLEDVDGDESLTWVRARNGERAAELAASAAFAARKQRLRSILDSEDKIPDVTRRGEHLYNFWKDATHERGLWRRTTLQSYRSATPEWETVLDLDALGQAEGENWVWHGAQVWRGEGPDAWRYALVSLSRGGADADVTREFDLHTKTFIEGGFEREESKGGMTWESLDAVIIYTDFGPGTMSPSGYPLVVKRWRRGTPIEAADTLYQGDPDDMYIGGGHDATPGFECTYISRRMTFWSGELYLVDGDNLTKVPTPDSAMDDVHRGIHTCELREDWTPGEVTYTAGSLLAGPIEATLAGATDFQVLYAPTPTSSLAGYTWTRDHLVLNILEDVTSRLEVLTPQPDGTFTRTAVEGLPSVGTLALGAVDAIEGNDIWLYITDFLTPTTLSLASISDGGALGSPEPLKSMPAFFDASTCVAEQHFVTSDDGTRVPYFLVRPADLAFDGTAPTLLYGYGGFEISLTPNYAAAMGASWLENGGVYAVANIRGGGEYGPLWHQAALKQNRHRAYQDMAAVARDLVERGVTSPAHLGVQGGSNGGLLTGNMLTQYPELFGAVIIQVPLLDMKRYSHLLAGASWMDEYGDPDDPQQWEFIKTFSPYHLFDGEREYPPTLFLTSTRDDRVHPGHARKMAAAMLAAGKDVTYYENIEGGHGGAATNDQAAHMQSLAYEFLNTRLRAAGT